MRALPPVSHFHAMLRHTMDIFLVSVLNSFKEYLQTHDEHKDMPSLKQNIFVLRAIFFVEATQESGHEYWCQGVRIQTLIPRM